MKLYEVMEELNTGKTIGELATNLGIRESDLERKVRNAAIVFDEDKEVWGYMGVSAEKSLSRNVNKKIRTLEADKPYVNYEKEYQEPKQTVVIEKDYEYKLYKDYLNVDSSLLMEKKTFFLSKETYKTIKRESTKKSLKINVLLNILLLKGLEHYNIDFVDNNEKEDMSD